MTVRTIQRRLLKLLAEKAKGVAAIREWGERRGWDMSSTLSSITSELCAYKDACEAADVDVNRIHEAMYPTKKAI